MPTLKSHAEHARQVADLLGDALEDNYTREPEEYESLTLSDALDTAEQLIETAGKVIYHAGYNHLPGSDEMCDVGEKLEEIAEAIREVNAKGE